MYEHILRYNQKRIFFESLHGTLLIKIGMRKKSTSQLVCFYYSGNYSKLIYNFTDIIYKKSDPKRSLFL